jgi:hypothetical protein
MDERLGAPFLRQLFAHVDGEIADVESEHFIGGTFGDAGFA